ncbi:hypothetical protein M758_6G192500 [Ceratodon purpureus]|uniref:Uncharacterized protein n=1 Tax=Ceratodon purpureus TaxID=3225 RepID=A0A8T0HJI5_CERPU|nr:hypothetical protein KC19_6G201100 [Ceratodon purpureus]KAG0614637.1 hypothetical protein M758_6G192500 [Ceratodon purpureus]
MHYRRNRPNLREERTTQQIILCTLNNCSIRTTNPAETEHYSQRNNLNAIKYSNRLA